MLVSLFKFAFVFVFVITLVFAFVFRTGKDHRHGEAGKFLRHCAMTAPPMHLIVKFTVLCAQCTMLQCSEMQYAVQSTLLHSSEQNASCSWRVHFIRMGVKIFRPLHPLLHYSSQHFFSSQLMQENIRNFQSLLFSQLFARSNVSFGGKCFKTGDPNVLTHVSSSELLQALKSCLAGKSSNGQRQRANVGVSSALYLGQLGEGERGS